MKVASPHRNLKVQINRPIRQLIETPAIVFIPLGFRCTSQRTHPGSLCQNSVRLVYNFILLRAKAGWSVTLIVLRHLHSLNRVE